MENLKEYFTLSQRWLPCLGKAPKRINATDTGWNVLGNQYTAKEVFNYRQNNPSMGWGTVTYKSDPLIILDVDKLTEEGLTYLNTHCSLPLGMSRVSDILSTLKIKDTLVEKSLSGKGLHIYLLLDNDVNNIPSITKYKDTLGGLCDHIELFNGGSNEDDSKGKFVVYTGNVIKDFKLEFSPTTPTTIQPVENNTVIYDDVKSLPVYTHKYPMKKLLDMLMGDKQFELLFTQGILYKEQDVNIDTLEVITEEVTDVSVKVFKLVSILVSHCQVFDIVNEIFKQSFFYKNTHWGEGKWDRLVATHNNSNPVLSAYNSKIRAARASGKPDCTFFKTPYTTEVIKEKNKELKSAAKEAIQLNTLNKIKLHIQTIMNNNEHLYSEYTKIDETFKKFDIENLDLDMLESDKYLSEMYWSLYPYTFAVNNDSQKDWITYDIEKKQYILINRETLRIRITNLLMELFPNKSHSFRKNGALATLDYYETLKKPIVDIYNNNSFLKLNNETNKGYYYKVKNGILDVLNCRLLNDTPNFLSFSELPFEIDEDFIEALKNKNYKEYIKDTLFFTFLTHSFPNDLTKQELIGLVNTSSLTPEEHDKFIFKYTGKSSNYRFSSQLKVLQRMLGYTMIPRHVYNSDKSLILYGVAGSGKSTLAKLLGYLLTGRKDLSGLTTTFAALERNAYALAPFKTTPLIVVNELPDRFSNEIRGTLNALISGESVEVNEKFKSNYSAQLPGKLVLVGNVLPKIIDDSGSLARRSVIVNFSVNVSKTENAIPDIDNKLIEPENLKAFFLFCLSGALDVLNHNYTVVSKIGLDLLTKMEKQNNPVEDLLKETVEFLTEKELQNDMIAKNYAVPRTELLSHIKTYLTSSNNMSTFTIKTWEAMSSKCQQIASVISKHFNQPEYLMYCPIMLGSRNKYKKHSTPVDAFRGIKLKDYNMEDTSDLEELNEVLNGSK